MKVGLDARTIYASRPRGTGRTLFDAYRLIPSLRPDWTFVLYHQRSAEACPLVSPPGGDYSWPPNARVRRIDIPGDRLDAWTHLAFPLAAWRDGCDLLHFPANVGPVWSPLPFVATVHDLAPLTVAGEVDAAGRRAFLRGLRRALRGARYILTPSQATADELTERFGIEVARLCVVPWAADRTIAERSASLDETEVVASQRRYGLNCPWLMHFAGRSPRKNAEAVIRALALLPGEFLDRIEVVFVGCGEAERLTTLAEQQRVRRACRFLGFVPHEDLPGLLRGSSGLLMPSRCEGFGLPILDAFACDTPVLASDRSSLPEVAGDAAVYCNPDDPASIAAGIQRLVDPATLPARVAAGRRRALAFTWERTARAICEVYGACQEATGRSGTALPAGGR